MTGRPFSAQWLTAQRRLGALALSGCGLTLALAATIGPLPPASDAPGASLVVQLPDPVRLLVLGLLALSIIMLLALQRPRLRNKKDPSLPHEARRPPAWAALVLLLPSLAVLSYFAWSHSYGRERDPLRTALDTISELLDLLAKSRKPPTSSPAFDVAIAVVVVAVSLAIFAAMVLITLAERLQHRQDDQAVTDAPPLHEVIEASLDDLRTDPDARRAIIGVYRRFEHALADAQVGRQPWETPSEFMRVALARLPMPVPPVERLTRLFELARFSDRPLQTDARDVACECLDRIQTALPSRTSDAA